MWVPQIPKSKFFNVLELPPSAIKLINGQVHTTHSENEKDVENETNDAENETKLKSNSISVSVQTEDLLENFDFRPSYWYKQGHVWLNQQENKVLKLALIILLGLVISMFWYLRYQVIIFIFYL